MLALAATAQSASAYVLTGSTWSEPNTTFHVGITNTAGAANAPSGISWDAAFAEAAAAWNDRTTFRFDIAADSPLDPCLDDLRNGVDFTLDICGADSFGANTLAITYSWSSGTGSFRETDILFNDNINWDVYAGEHQFSPADFRRVAVHELGHALGLDHEDTTTAIMSSFAGDLEVPQPDDVNGVTAMYGGTPPPPPVDCPDPVALGLLTSRSAALNGDDCTVADVLGGADNSFVDRYRITLPQDGILALRMTSDSFDPYLWLLSDSGDRILAQDDNAGGDTSARILRDLRAGTYQVLANSSRTSATTGVYTISTALFGSSFQRPALTTHTTTGAPSEAEFWGGATSDTVKAFGADSLPSDDTVNVSFTLAVAPADLGRMGRIYVLGAVDDDLYMRDRSGRWIPWDGDVASLVPAEGPRTLNALELVEAVAGPLDEFAGSRFRFMIGYRGENGTIHYHDPVGFSVSP